MQALGSQIPIVIDSSDEEEASTEEDLMCLDDTEAVLGKELLVDWDGLSRNKKRWPHVSPQDLEKWHTSESYDVPVRGQKLTHLMDIELIGGVFMRIHDFISRTATSEKFMRGTVFLRNGQNLSTTAKSIIPYNEDDMSSFLILQLNEVHCSAHRIGITGTTSALQSLRIFPVKCFVRVRKIIVTNQLYPRYNPKSADHLAQYERPQDVLVCRWAIFQDWRNAKDLGAGTKSHCRKQIYRIRQIESDRFYAVSDSEIMFNFRGHTTKGGSSFGVDSREFLRHRYRRQRLREASRRLSGQPHTVGFIQNPVSFSDVPFELDDDDYSNGLHVGNDEFWTKTYEFSRKMLLPKKQRYSMADYFCGCGGATVAATEAGFNVKYAVDIEKDMCATYLLNNPAARVACTDVKRFAGPAYAYNKKIDILHLSPPCQPVSRPHTTPGKNDEKNLEALAMVEEIINATKPRIVTMEEADALATYQKHLKHFNRIILQLTMLGFSVDFQIVQLAHFGLAQKRERLVLIAACPGQRLPGFPNRTHCERNEVLLTGLSPLSTLRAAVAKVPHVWTRHNPEDERLLCQGEEVSKDALARTVITRNGHLLHPEGWRKCTIMETLVIQGFPLYFEFPNRQTETQIRKQIGNAVPPLAFLEFFLHIERQLLKDDDMLGSNGRRRFF